MAKHALHAFSARPDGGHATAPIPSDVSAAPDPWFLLAEQRHRTKNLFQLMDSLLNHAIGDATPGANAALRRIQAQLAGFGLLNDMLGDGEARAPDIPCCARYIAAIAQLVGSSCLEPLGVKLTRTMPPSLPADATSCRYLGLILTELMFNAAKHAFPSGGGTVLVSLGVTASHIHLRVADDGMGLDDTLMNARSGQGRTFIETLAKALHATLECRSSSLGTTCDIRVPLPATTTADVAAPSIIEGWHACPGGDTFGTGYPPDGSYTQ